MTLVSCSVDERYVNPLFEVFDGGDFVLSSYRDVEARNTELRLFMADAADAPRAIEALTAAAEVVGVTLAPEVSSIPDEDWKLSYRRHFKTEVISPRLVLRPPWEDFTPTPGQKTLTLDPGLAFGTGQHPTTRACLDYVDALAVENPDRSFLDVGCGSGILALAAALEGFREVAGFDIDPEAVTAANENAEKNGLDLRFTRGDLCRVSTLPGVAKGGDHRFDVVAANVLGPVLVRFAKEIVRTVAESPAARLILSGILVEVYPEVQSAYESLGFREVSSRTIGEWKTGLFAPQ